MCDLAAWGGRVARRPPVPRSTGRALLHRGDAAAARGERPDDELVLLLGADQAAACRSGASPRRSCGWPRSRSPTGGRRSGRPCRGALRFGRRRAGDFFEMPAIEVSSTDVRERVAAAPAVPVPGAGAVADRIEERGLYRGERGEGRTSSPASSEALARRIAAIALDKKAHDVAVLDMRGVVAYTDFLVIATGNTERQTQAIEDAIYRELKARRRGTERTPERVEGTPEGRWILMDYLDCVVHVFTPAARDYYRLETLWGEVPALGGRGGASVRAMDGS